MERNKAEIRSQILRQRRQLTQAQCDAASRSLATIGCKIAPLSTANTIASYLAHQGEICPNPLLSALKQTPYLPRIVDYNNNIMRFYPAHSTLIKNVFGILEPEPFGAPLKLQCADVILLPLVAFNRQGHRLGMGGGCYDRALQELKQPNKPLLIGMAHAFQEVEHIPMQQWDVKCDMVLSDQELITIN